MGNYRPNVAGIFQDANGRILIAERRDFPGCWQFPQGGVDQGEELGAAFLREMWEELQITPDQFEIVEVRGGYRYAFPEGHRKARVYTGQEQTYYRCRFTGDPARIRTDSSHPEFRAVRWIAPESFRLDWLPPFKREVYRRVLRDFFAVEPGA